MTILEYKSVLENRLSELENEMIMAKARVQVVDEIIAMGVDFKRNDEATEDCEDEIDENAEVVEPEEETETDGNLVMGV